MERVKEKQTAEAIMKIELLWPDKNLNPNARIHWSKKHILNQKSKDDAIICALSVINEPLNTRGLYKVRYIFYPPDNHKRDLDNIEAACKGAFDGVAYALGIDDHQIIEVAKRWGEVVYGGKVVYEIEEIFLSGV